MGLYIFETLILKRKIHGKKSRNRILIYSKRLPFHSGLAQKRTKIQNTADSIKKIYLVCRTYSASCLLSLSFV